MFFTASGGSPSVVVSIKVCESLVGLFDWHRCKCCHHVIFCLDIFRKCCVVGNVNDVSMMISIIYTIDSS